MAHVDDNDITLGLRGRIGKQIVFRKFGNKTIVSKRPKRSSKPPTEGQLLHREKFIIAANYATRSLLQPELKAEYEAIARTMENTSAFAAALADFVKVIEIKEIVAQFYNGEAGFPLPVIVSDLYKVKTMKVTMTDAGGNTIETGEATLANGESGYKYITTTSIADITGVKVKVEVTDRPGKVVVKEIVL